MNILDIIFVVILAYGAYRGYQKGLFATVSRVAGYLAALVGAVLLYQPLALFLGNEMRFREALSPWIAETMAIPAASFQTEINDVAFDKAKAILEGYRMPEVFNSLMEEIISKISEVPSAGINSLGEGITYTVSGYILNAVSFVLIYILLSVLFRIIIPKVFTSVNPKPVTFLDKICGSVLGMGGGMLTVSAIIILLTPLASMGAMKGNDSPLANMMAGSITVDKVMGILSGFF